MSHTMMLSQKLDFLYEKNVSLTKRVEINLWCKNSQSLMYSHYSVSLKVFSLGRTRRGAKFELPSAHWLTAGKIDDYAQAARGSTQNRYILKAKQSPPIKTITKEIPMKDLIKTYEQQFGKGFPILTPRFAPYFYS